MGCTPATLLDYSSRLDLFCSFLEEFFPSVTIIDATRQVVEQYLAHKRHQGRSDYTLRTTYRALNAFFNWALDEELITRSPLAKIKPPRVPKTMKPFLSEGDFARLLAACPEDRFSGARGRAAMWILWTSGVRFTELCNIHLEDLDSKRECIQVLGKGRKHRFVEYPAEAKAAVWKYMKFRDDQLPQLWLGEDLEPLTGHGMKRHLVRLYAKAGVEPHDMFHIFRRTWAMNKLRDGVPFWDVMILAGWESPATMDRYVRGYRAEQVLEQMRTRAHSKHPRGRG